MMRTVTIVVACVALLSVADVRQGTAQQPTACIALDMSASLVGGPSVAAPLDPDSTLGAWIVDQLFERLSQEPVVVVFARSATSIEPWGADKLTEARQELGQETDLVNAWQSCTFSGASQIVVVSDFAPDAQARPRDVQLHWFSEHLLASGAVLHGLAFDGDDPGSLAFFQDVALRSGGTFAVVRDADHAAEAVDMIANALGQATPTPTSTASPFGTTTSTSEPEASATEPARLTPVVGGVQPPAEQSFELGRLLIALTALIGGVVGGIFLMRHTRRAGTRPSTAGGWQVGARANSGTPGPRRNLRPMGIRLVRGWRRLDSSPSEARMTAGYTIIDSQHRPLMVVDPGQTTHVDCSGPAPRTVQSAGPQVLTVTAHRVVYGFRPLMVTPGKPAVLNERFCLVPPVAGGTQ